MKRALALLTLVALAALGGCSDSNPDESAGRATGAEPTSEVPTTVRLGYFPNVTHAPAVAGVEKGIFAEALGDDALDVKTFNAGPAAVEALFAGALDATFIGPNPAINAFVTSKGEAVRIIAGSTSGGAALVVKPEIEGVEDLKGKKVASPQLGNTQDVALRYWLDRAGLQATAQGGGDVSIAPQENAQTLETFKSGEIAGAWVPEPWVTRLVQEGGGKVLVDEKTLWPGDRFVTTHLIVRTAFLDEHPGAVERLLEGTVKAVEFVNANPGEAQQLTNQGIEKITGKGLAPAVIQSAWRNLEFTVDPVASSLKGSADHAAAVGLLRNVDLEGIYELRPLNAILDRTGQAGVKAL